MRAIYRETFGPSALIVDPALQMSRAHAELKLLAGEGGGEFVRLLNAVATRLPDAGSQHVETLTYEAGRLTLSLRAREARHNAALVAQLRAKSPAQGVAQDIEIRV